MRKEDKRAPHHNLTKRKKKSSTKKCQRCGEDPWPNYFFCPTCHEIVSRDGALAKDSDCGLHNLLGALL